jgi:hypothetical protein
MTFHQHYEFLALDRPLRADELAEVRRISSHATVSATRFAVSYDFGDLRGNPEDMLVRWFDLYLYRSSNGASLTFKLPAGVLAQPTIDRYAIDQLQDFDVRDESLLVSWMLEEDDGGGWIDDDRVASEATDLALVRAALARGEVWPLHVGWLSAISLLEADDLEPPVPAGLSGSDPRCQALAAFLGVSEDLLAAAAETSAVPDPARERAAMTQWLQTLPSAQRDAALAAWLAGEDVAALLELRKAFAATRQSSESALGKSLRTVAKLQARAVEIGEARRRIESERKARERAKHLEAVAKGAEKLWAGLPALADGQSRSAYDAVVNRLRDLRDAADKHGVRSDFDKRFAVFIDRISPTRVLFKRIREAGFLSGR